MGAETAPRRRWEVLVSVGGDSWEDVEMALRDVLPHIEEHGSACGMVSGSPSCGFWVQVSQNPEQTHEKWAEELDAYLEKRRALPEATP